MAVGNGEGKRGAVARRKEETEERKIFDGGVGGAKIRVCVLKKKVYYIYIYIYLILNNYKTLII